MSCREVFASYAGEERQRQVALRCPAWSCEKEQCAEGSPGPVKNEETLIFLVINPTHFDQGTGELAPTAFMEIHKRDLSLIRASYAQEEEICSVRDELLRLGASKVPPQKRQVDFYCKADAYKIRTIVDDEGERFFGVYDTALPERASHCSVFTTPKVLDSKRRKFEARAKLHSVFSPNVAPISEVISG